VVIGHVSPNLSNPTLAALDLGQQKAAEQLGWSVRTVDAGLSPDRQVSSIDTLINLKVEALIKFDNAVNAVRVFELKPDAFSASIQAAGMDLQVAGIIRTDANALFGKKLGTFFRTDRDVDDNAGCH